MNLIQPQPKLAIQVTKAKLEIIPAAIEINRAVQSLLEHCPPPTGGIMITVHVKGPWTIRVDCINTADPITWLVHFSTVFAIMDRWRTVEEDLLKGKWRIQIRVQQNRIFTDYVMKFISWSFISCVKWPKSLIRRFSVSQFVFSAFGIGLEEKISAGLIGTIWYHF